MPVHVLGIAGLLDQPVIADLVCVLRALHDPTAGSELVRVLGGARWRIGPADLAALNGLARWLADRDLGRRRLDDDVRQGLRASIAPDESPSIVDALDFLLTAPDGHSALREFTEVGLGRMRRAGAQLQSLRRRAGLGLVDFVHLVQQELLLDIEVAANAAQPLGAPSLEAFDELLAGFADVAEHPTLGAFLGWLTEAEQRDRLAPRQDEPEPGAVQVLSIHGSKGLEWDVVAIPRLVDEELPSKPRTTKGWLAFGELPNDFKGDRAELPELQWRGVQSQAAFDEAVRAFADENRERHADEERRLAYVALTRTRSELLLTGSWWASQKSPRKPSAFLRELARAGILDPTALPTAPEAPENPREGAGSRRRWPLDPLGTRRGTVHAAADAVRAAAERPSGAGIGPRLADELRLLLEDRRRRSRGPTPRRSRPASPRRASRTTSTTPRRSPNSFGDRCRSVPIGRPASARCSTRGSSIAPRARATHRRSTTSGRAPLRSTSNGPTSRSRMPRSNDCAPCRPRSRRPSGAGASPSRSNSSCTCPSTSTCSCASSTPSTTCRPAGSWRPAASGTRSSTGRPERRPVTSATSN